MHSYKRGNISMQVVYFDRHRVILCSCIFCNSTCKVYLRIDFTAYTIENGFEIISISSIIVLHIQLYQNKKSTLSSIYQTFPEVRPSQIS